MAPIKEAKKQWMNTLKRPKIRFCLSELIIQGELELNYNPIFKFKKYVKIDN